MESTDPLYLSVASFVLVCPSNCGSGSFTRDDSSETLLQVVAGEVGVLFPQDLVPPGRFIDSTGKGRPEARYVSAPLDSIDEVCEGEDPLYVAVVVLDAYLDCNAFALSRNYDRRSKEGVLPLLRYSTKEEIPPS
jgi:hypothetical protein